MLIIAFLTAYSLASLGFAYGQDFTFSTDFKSRYVSQIGTPLSKGPVLQSSLTATFKNGCWFNIWGSKSLDRRGQELDFGDEIDYTFACSGGFNGLTWKAGIGYWDLARIFDRSNDVVQSFIELNRRFDFGAHALTPYIVVRPTLALQERDGIRSEVGLRHFWKFTESLGIASTVKAGYDTGAIGLKPGPHYGLGITPTWSISPRTDLRISAEWSQGQTGTFWVFGAGIEHKFLVPK